MGAISTSKSVWGAVDGEGESERERLCCIYRGSKTNHKDRNGERKIIVDTNINGSILESTGTGQAGLQCFHMVHSA